MTRRRRLYITVILIYGVTTAINVDKFFLMTIKTGNMPFEERCSGLV